MWNYSEQVMDHFLNPRNVGEIENPDGLAEVGNITCGDALKLTFKVDKEGKISDIKFKTFGCGSAIASASMLTELVKGKTVEEAEKITNKDIANALQGLPRQKMHCSVMGQEALEKAIQFYRSKGKNNIVPNNIKKGTIVCTCFNVTDEEIKKAILENNLNTIEDVTNFTKAGGGCGGCHPQIQNILNQLAAVKKEMEASRQSFPQLTTVEKIDRIREVINKEINPLLAADGGSCELVELEGNQVIIKLKGHCSTCTFSNITLTSVIEKQLRKHLFAQLNVVVS